MVVHDDVNTLLVVTWEQVLESEQVWLEFGIAGEDVLRSRPGSGRTGPHRDVVLGVPGGMEVEIRVVNLAEGEEVFSAPVLGGTDPVPAGMPVPEIVAFDQGASSPERWMLGSVEDSSGNLPADYLLGSTTRPTNCGSWMHYRSRGMVVKSANGNCLGNYGTHGVIRELTANHQTVFDVKLDHDGEDDHYNKLVGNNEYIADPYALNGAPTPGGAQ